MKGILGTLNDFIVRNIPPDPEGNEMICLENRTARYLMDSEGKILIGKYNLMKKEHFNQLFPENPQEDGL